MVEADHTEKVVRVAKYAFSPWWFENIEPPETFCLVILHSDINLL